MSYFLFDIGGSKMRFAVTKDCVECTKPKIVKTPPTYEEAMQVVAEVARGLMHDKGIKHAVGGCAGTFNKERTKLKYAPNLETWVGKPITKDLSRSIGVPVTIENDTAVIALGEAVSGAGKKGDIVAYMTVSTGVGGSRVIKRKMDVKAQSFEPGHQIIDIEKGTTLENLVSGTAVKERYGVEPYDITDEETWKQIAQEIAVGVYNTILHWSPDVMVLGGSMFTGKGPVVPIDEVKAHLKKLSPTLTDSCEVVVAELGDLNGIYGALAWAEQLYDGE